MCPHVASSPRTPLLIFKENKRWPEGITASGTRVVPPSFPAIYIKLKPIPGSKVEDHF